MIGLRLWLVLALAFGLLPGHLVAQEEVGDTARDFLIEPGRAGEIFVGITPWEARRVVGEGPLELLDQYLEVSFTPTAVLRVPGGEADAHIVAHLDMLQCDGFSEWYFPILDVRDPRYRTVDGIGVGSTLAEARDLGWVDEHGRPTGPAMDNEAPNFARIRFIYEGKEGECDGCPPPEPNAVIVSVRLRDPGPWASQRRCEQLRVHYPWANGSGG